MATISVSLPSDGQTIDAADVNSPINTIVAAINGNLDNDNIKSGANIDGSKLGSNTTALSILNADGRGGWISGVLPAPNTISYLGNNSYTAVFNTVDLTSYIFNGMRLRGTRTVTAPTQCTDLESGSSQYYSKSSPSGMTFTDDFVVSAWIKLESYAQMVIASRYNGTSGWTLELDATGAVFLTGRNAGASNISYVLSRQSIPLNKWVHVAAQLDMSSFTVSDTTSYVMIDGLNVDAAVSRGGTNPTALVQAGNLEIGGANAGTLPFDGKIAQVAIYSAKITQATIRATIPQTLSGSETSLISAYSFNNTINDLNTSNANNLTAQNSAVATNADSPFAGGTNASTAYTAGTNEFAEVFDVIFSTNTTVTIQVPAGYAWPTSGGVSAVAYSTASKPLGWAPIELIGFSKRCADVTATNTSDNTAMPGSTVTVYIPKGRSAEVTVPPLRAAFNSGANNTQLSLWQGTVGSGIKLGELLSSTGTTPIPFPGLTTVFTPAVSGSTTFNVGTFVGGGTGTYQMSTTYPFELRVKLTQGE